MAKGKKSVEIPDLKMKTDAKGAPLPPQPEEAIVPPAEDVSPEKPIGLDEDLRTPKLREEARKIVLAICDRERASPRKKPEAEVVAEIGAEVAAFYARKKAEAAEVKK